MMDIKALINSLTDDELILLNNRIQKAIANQINSGSIRHDEWKHETTETAKKYGILSKEFVLGKAYKKWYEKAHPGMVANYGEAARVIGSDNIYVYFEYSGVWEGGGGGLPMNVFYECLKESEGK